MQIRSATWKKENRNSAMESERGASAKGEHTVEFFVPARHNLKQSKGELKEIKLERQRVNMHFATGAMGTLLPKLGALLLEEYRLNKVVKQGIKDLRDELTSMQGVLVKLSDVPLDQLDPQVKIWADDVRELSYAIEDSLDYYMVRLEPTTTEHDDTFMAFIKKTSSKFTDLKTRHKIASNIKDIEKQDRKVKERYDRYKVEDVVANIATTTTVDPRLLALYSSVSDLVGIDKSLDQIMKRLSDDDDDDVTGKKLKTVSVVGFGGLGKTTLAKAVYGELKKKFDCAGFVPVGQKPSMEKVLKDILYEFDKQKYMNISALKLDVRQLIDEVKDFLANKRYLIVIDDIWDIQTWNVIKCALVDSNPGTRIITTTRILEVAKRVGVYNMEPLSEENSRKLFNTRIFGGPGISPDDQPAEASDKILRKCGGVPLAIITISSLLVNKSRDEWFKVYDSIGFGDEDNEAVQNTRKIISYSHYDLPSHLKSLMLYLSIYQENGVIPKEQLVWMWVGEGFIPEKPGIGLFELGESYLKELINRSMIQLTEPFSRLNFCTVHDMVLDLMRTLSKELNFVTVQEMEQLNTCSTNRSNSSHRLSFHNKEHVEHDPSMEMGHVRSFIAIHCHDIRMPPLQSFKALRVLVLENCDFSIGDFSLKSLHRLLQLRYLGLAATPLAELPRKIGHLKLLQFLNIADCAIKELPSSVSELRNLMLLSAPQAIMRGEVGKLRALEELCLGSVDKSPNFVRDLADLMEMRALRIGCTEMDESMQKFLVESLQKLRRIQILNIGLESEDMEIHCFHGFEDWAPPSELSQLWLIGMYLSRRPSWMDFSFVPHLSSLNLTVQVLEGQDMQILGKLPALLFLKLYTLEATIQWYSVASHEFKKLGLLVINIEIICEEGALPMLYSLNCYADVRKDVGLVGNMPLLEDVTYSLHCKGCILEEVEKAEEALRQDAKTHPSRPKITIQRLKHKEISLADVLMVGTYLKDVLHVSEEGSSADEKVSTVEYYTRVLHLSGDTSGVLESATHLKAVLYAPEEVWATDKYVRAFAIHLKDKVHFYRNVSATNEEEVSLADVRMVAAYLKDVLRVSEGVSPTVAYVRNILHISKENSDEDVLNAANHLRDVLHAPEEVWAYDKLLCTTATYFKDNKLPVSTNKEEIPLADVHAAATYLKDVLHVSEEGSSATGEEMPSVAYLRHVLFVSEENSDQEVLAIATHFRRVLHASEDVWAWDQLVRSAVPLYKDKLPVSGDVSDTDEEISVADVRAAATYLKEALHVSEGPVSGTDEEMPTVAYLRDVLGLPENIVDERVVLEVATYLRHLLHASEDVWLTDGDLRRVLPLFKDKLPVYGEVSDTNEELSDKVEAAKDCSAVVKTREPAHTQELDADLNRLALDSTRDHD